MIIPSRIRDQLPAQIRDRVLFVLPQIRDGMITDNVVLETSPDNNYPYGNVRRFVFEVTPEGKLRDEDIAHLCAVL